VTVGNIEKGGRMAYKRKKAGRTGEGNAASAACVHRGVVPAPGEVLMKKI
jgi:hypothetical protein